MKFDMSPDDFEDHHEETTSIINEIDSLKLLKRFNPMTVGITMVKIASLSAIRCGVSKEDFMRLCGEYHEIVKAILISDGTLDS